MKTYLITGAAHGLGRELAIALATNGNQLILLDKDTTTLNLFYDDLMANFDCDITLLPMDLLGANPDHYDEVKQSLASQFKQLDAVFLNAASLPACTPVEHFEIERWYESLQINLNANFHLIQTVLPSLKNATPGKLIAMLDKNITEHPANYGAYGVAKAGLKQLMRSIAVENENPSCYLVNLPAFQSNTRSKQFPSENPNEIATAGSIAMKIVEELNHQNPNELELIEKL